MATSEAPPHARGSEMEPRCRLAARRIQLEHESRADRAAAAHRTTRPPHVHVVVSRGNFTILESHLLEEVGPECVDVAFRLDSYGRTVDAVRRLVVTVH